MSKENTPTKINGKMSAENKENIPPTPTPSRRISGQDPSSGSNGILSGITGDRRSGSDTINPPGLFSSTPEERQSKLKNQKIRSGKRPEEALGQLNGFQKEEGLHPPNELNDPAGEKLDAYAFKNVRFTPSQWKPESKTALGRLSYDLTKLPDLYVYDFKVVDNNDEELLSRRLRHKVVQEFLRKHNIDATREMLAVNPWAWKRGSVNFEKKIPIHQLVVPVSSRTVISAIDKAARGTQPKLLTKKLEATGERGSNPLATDVKCSLSPTHTLLKSGDTDLDNATMYRESLDVLFRSFASPQTSRGEKTAYCWYGINREFLPDHILNVDVRTIKPLLDMIRSAKAEVRPQIKLDAGQLQLHIDFDLVPCMKTHNLADLMIDLFGSNILGPDVQLVLIKMKHMLLGLKFRTDYTSEAFKERSQIARGASFNSQSPYDYDPRREGVISEVSLPGDVERFPIKHGEDIVEHYSVAKYFKNVIQKEVKYTNLPYVNIGRAQAGRRTWIPLERLFVYPEQVLKRMGHLTPVLQETVKKVQNLNNAAGMMGAVAARILNAIQTSDQLLGTISSDPILRLPAQPRNGTKPGTMNEDHSQNFNKLRDDCEHPRIAIVYVAPSTDRIGRAPYEVDAIKNRRESALEDIGRKLQTSSPVKFSEYEFAIVTSGEDLILKQYESGHRIQEWCQATKKPSVLLGLVDTDGRTKADVDTIYHEFYKLGNRRIGTTTVVAKFNAISELIAGNSDKEDYLPPGLLRKIYFMLGHTRNEIEPLSLPTANIKLTSLMIVGAHVSHPGSDASKYCPSVAAVVASTDKDAVKYPGSSRMQATSQKVSQNGNGDTKVWVPNARIQKLEEMMIERFQAWKSSGAPTGVLFYRDGLVYAGEVSANDPKDTCDAESKAITAAFKKVFPNESVAPVTYVIINKDVKSPKPTTPVTFTTETGEEMAKYRYHIAKDSLEIGQASLKELTQKLNKRYELAPTVAFALPVFYAHKLCQRMFDYFYWHVTNDLSNIPSMVRQFGSEDPVKNEEKMIDFVGDYFTGKRAAEAEQPANSRITPWAKSLDDKMFYL